MRIAAHFRKGEPPWRPVPIPRSLGPPRPARPPGLTWRGRPQRRTRAGHAGLARTHPGRPGRLSPVAPVGRPFDLAHGGARGRDYDDGSGDFGFHPFRPRLVAAGGLPRGVNAVRLFVVSAPRRPLRFGLTRPPRPGGRGRFLTGPRPTGRPASAAAGVQIRPHADPPGRPQNFPFDGEFLECAGQPGRDPRTGPLEPELPRD